MARQLTTQPSSRPSLRPRRLDLLLTALPALVASVAALVVAASGSPAPADGALLAVGAIALLAGHAWGNLVVLAAHVPLAAHLAFSTMPAQAAGLPVPDAPHAVALGLIAITLLPTLVFAGRAAPATLAALGQSATSTSAVRGGIASGATRDASPTRSR